jgi:DNA-binding XRE family transcriptional regulator
VSQDASGFGARLRACREVAGLSQEELAERSGLSLRTIGNLERGRTRPYRASVQQLAAGLNLRGQDRTAFVAAARRRDRGVVPGAAAGSGSSHDPNAVPTPRQLPTAVPGFTGRNRELAALSEVLGRAAGTAVIAAVGGTAGVGKTALAVHWAHRVAAEFPDGQLYLDLRGFDPSGPPVEPADAVRVLLEALGVTGARLPGTVEAQLGLYRTKLTGQRVLIVLDNALDEAQVRPLLPGSVTCRVVVTSRNQLTGLVATAAAYPIMLDVLTSSEAHDLLQQRIGRDRLQSDPQAAARIIEASARLPLALCIVAARAVLQPQSPLTQLADDVSCAPGLTAFSSPGDEAADIRTLLSWSYRQLDAACARAFRLASLHPGQDIDRFAVAVLAGLTPEYAAQILELLARACLIQAAGPGRYRMHDLLRRYARELADLDSEPERRAALTRLLDYYLQSAAAAMDVLFPAEHHLRPLIAAAPAALPAMAGPDDARAWLDQERANLVAAVVLSADHGWARHTAALAAMLYRYLTNGSYLAEGVTIYDHALQAARRSGDVIAEASALNGLGHRHLERPVPRSRRPLPGRAGTLP